MMKRFEVDDKRVAVFPAATAGAPLVCLNVYGDGSNAATLDGLLRPKISGECNLVVVGNLNWDCDMAPWDCPPISRNDTPCGGGADAYLELLLTKILPQAEACCPQPFAWRGIAGYSLAGLFAVYALYRARIFTRAASASGSLWFPDFDEYVRTHELAAPLERIYFSLGDRECRARNRYLSTVQERTEAIVAHFRELGVPTQWTLNPGNHYRDAEQRMAAGLAWILNDG